MKMLFPGFAVLAMVLLGSLAIGAPFVIRENKRLHIDVILTSEEICHIRFWASQLLLA